jgi:hypothetical protein
MACRKETSKNPGVDKRIILKEVLKTGNGRV